MMQLSDIGRRVSWTKCSGERTFGTIIGIGSKMDDKTMFYAVQVEGEDEEAVELFPEYRVRFVS